LKTYLPHLLVVLCVLFWSGNFVLGRFVNEEIDALELAFFRWSFVVILLLPLLFFVDVRKIFRTLRTHFVTVSVLAVLSVTLFNTLLYTALHTTSATNALLINSSVPILILVLSAAIFRDAISRRQVTGIALSTAGVVFLILQGSVANLVSLQLHAGDFWVLASSLVWALYSVLYRLRPKTLSDLELFVTNMYVGYLYLLPLYLAQGYAPSAEVALLERYWPHFIYVSLFASILSYLFWNFGIDRLGAAKTGQFTHLMPLFGALLAYLILGETLQYYHALGALLIGSGIYLSLFASRGAGR